MGNRKNCACSTICCKFIYSLTVCKNMFYVDNLVQIQPRWFLKRVMTFLNNFFGIICCVPNGNSMQRPAKFAGVSKACGCADRQQHAVPSKPHWKGGCADRHHYAIPYELHNCTACVLIGNNIRNTKIARWLLLSRHSSLHSHSVCNSICTCI